jgi:hypothetical protein
MEGIFIMKKKLLSLVLAGAMVASTSVSAFADAPRTQEVTSFNEGSNTANVEIKGSVDKNNGDSAAGTISVSIPTALNFRVDKNGDISGGKITITNNGVDSVDVTAFKFQDRTPGTKITVKTPQNLDSLTRDNVVLSIRGNKAKKAYFKTVTAGQDESGIVDETGNDEANGIKVSTIRGYGDTDELSLEGYAGKGELTDTDAIANGITDDFTLTLKITKAEKN